MVAAHQFHLGPVGALRALPSPSLGAGPDATAVKLGAVHRSLGGRVTVDRLAVKRGWSLSWPYLDPTTAAYLDALHLGLVAGPLWLLDPERPNRLPVAVAATGSGDRTTTGFAVSAGTLAWTSTVPDVGLPIAGGLSWAVPAAGGQLTPDATVPVVPGEPLVVSVFAASADVPIQVQVRLYNLAGGQSTVKSSTAVIPGAGGARLSVTITPTLSVAARVTLSASATTTGGQVTTSGWQLEPGITPTPWSPGDGITQVVLDSLTTAYPVPGSRASTLTLLEV